MSAPSLPTGFDFTDPALWEIRNPVQEFTHLRHTAPVWWNAQADESSGGFHDGAPDLGQRGGSTRDAHVHIRQIAMSDAVGGFP